MIAILLQKQKCDEIKILLAVKMHALIVSKLCAFREGKLMQVSQFRHIYCMTQFFLVILQRLIKTEKL